MASMRPLMATLEGRTIATLHALSVQGRTVARDVDARDYAATARDLRSLVGGALDERNEVVS